MACQRSVLLTTLLDTWLKDVDFLHDHLSTHGIRESGPVVPSGLKCSPLYGTVADVWGRYENAEDPRRVLNELNNRRKYPWKTLAFDQQIRPPYSGELPQLAHTTLVS